MVKTVIISVGYTKYRVSVSDAIALLGITIRAREVVYEDGYPDCREQHPLVGDFGWDMAQWERALDEVEPPLTAHELPDNPEMFEAAPEPPIAALLDPLVLATRPRADDDLPPDADDEMPF